MLFNIWVEEVVKVQAVIFITSYIKLNTDRKYKGINIYMVYNKGTMTSEN